MTGAGGAHGSQSVRADEAADDDRIGHVVKLLENIADQQWQGKFEYDGQRFALSHILFHKILHRLGVLRRLWALYVICVAKKTVEISTVFKSRSDVI